MKNEDQELKRWYIMYYYPPYKIGWTKCYNTELEAVTESIARNVFRQQYPNAVIKGIADYPAS